MNRLMAAIALVFMPMLAPAVSMAQSDPTQTFLTTPSFPLTSPLPTNSAATPGDGLSLTSGASNAFSLVMGSGQAGANLTTSQSIRDTFFLNYIVGNLTTPNVSPTDTGQNSVEFAAVARHYAVGDPNDVHVMMDDGMHLRAICSANHTNCSNGNVYAAMIRVPFEIRPNMTIKVRYKSPPGMYSWAPIWMLSGSQISPGPGGNPYSGFGTSNTLLQLPVGQDTFEIDLNDNYPRLDSSPPVQTGYQLDYGTPNIYGNTWNTPPHILFFADTDGYNYYGNATPPFDQLPFNWSAGFHDLVMSWDGNANTIYIFVDGVEVAASYMEYGRAPTYTDSTGTVKVQAMHLIIGNQAVPAFTTGFNGQENNGIPDGWTIVVQEISAWYGTVANPDSHLP
jgi:hypothetical protein